MVGHLEDGIAPHLEEVVDPVEVEGQPVISRNWWIVHRSDGDRHRVHVGDHRAVGAGHGQRVRPVVVERALVGKTRQGRVDVGLAARHGQGGRAVGARTDRRPATERDRHRPVEHAQLHRREVAVHIRDADAAQREGGILIDHLRPRHRVHRRIVHRVDHQ